MKSLGYYCAFIAIALGLMFVSRGVAAEDADLMEVTEPVPMITKVEPVAVTPWSYMVILGENLAEDEASCAVTVGGSPAFVVDCSPTYIRLVVPWIIQNETVTVAAYGLTSPPAAIDVAPLNLKNGEIVPGGVHLKHKSGTDIEGILSTVDDLVLNAKPLADAGDVYLEDWFALEVTPGTEVHTAETLSTIEGVLYAGPVPMPMSTDTPNDEFFPDQWALSKIDAPTAWGVSKGGGIKIAVIDYWLRHQPFRS